MHRDEGDVRQPPPQLAIGTHRRRGAVGDEQHGRLDTAATGFGGEADFAKDREELLERAVTQVDHSADGLSAMQLIEQLHLPAGIGNIDGEDPGAENSPQRLARAD